MNKGELEVGRDYAVILHHRHSGRIDLANVGTFRRRVGRCRLVDKDAKATSSSSYKGTVRVLQFELVEDFQAPETWRGEPGELRKAGTTVTKETGREVVLPWEVFERRSEEYDLQQAQRQAVQDAARARYEAVGRSLAAIGVGLAEPPSYRHAIGSVTVDLDDAEKLAAAIDALDEIARDTGEESWSPEERLKAISDTVARVRSGRTPVAA